MNTRKKAQSFGKANWNKDKVPTSFYIAPELRRQLKAQAALKDMSMSEYVEYLIEKELGRKQ